MNNNSPWLISQFLLSPHTPFPQFVYTSELFFLASFDVFLPHSEPWRHLRGLHEPIRAQQGRHNILFALPAFQQGFVHLCKSLLLLFTASQLLAKILR
mmetsp:Transcript_31470/g.57157  ORF Transcript_31470/g.57157 Transcript_31470/m.57157 type:complete len:98 (-) Transcript_31470:2191-2484(-)